MSSTDRRRILLAWSSGKDSALALEELRSAGREEVVALLTTVTEDYRRVSMHGVREELLDRQAREIGLPLVKVRIPAGANMGAYERRMAEALAEQAARGVTGAAFGDLFLEDVRRYREEKMRLARMEAVFPLWGRDTAELSRQVLARGIRAVVTCVDCRQLDRRFAGRMYDESFLAELPAGVDPCGEEGEFHTFVFDGPMFRRALSIRLGRTVLRDGRFCFCDVEEAA